MMDPNAPCRTCAFGKSGGAADETTNLLKSQLAAFSAVPFWCHHSRSGPEYDWENSILGPFELPVSERRVCAGWKASVKENFAAGGRFAFLREETGKDAAVLRRYQRSLGHYAMDALDRFKREKDPAKKAEILKDLKSTCKAVFSA